jgi:ribonuclease HI
MTFQSHEEITMSNVFHLHERQMRVDDYIGYASGITGFQHPGPLSIAYLLIAPDGTELERELINTNMSGSGHDAEYLAVMYLSRAVATSFPDVKNLRIFSSSQLVVNQLCGRWSTYTDRFRIFGEKIRSNLKHIQWDIAYIPRPDNQLKDWHWERYEESHPEESLTDSVLKQIVKSRSARGEN